MARTPATDPPPELDPAAKPLWRGRTHQWAFFISLVTGAVLVLAAPGAEAKLAAAIYAVAVAGLFGVSALYHRVTWRSVAARRRMRQLDHSMIFVLIAGTYTPIGVLALEGWVATTVLIVVWSGALAGIFLKIVWIDAPNWLAALIYVLLGWVALIAFPQLFDEVGVAGTLLVALGGVLYSVGAGVYAFKRPDPLPRVFGYHEVFHLLVIVAAALHYAVVAGFVLPESA